MSNFYSEVNVKKARKSHKCECCSKWIEKGLPYHKQTGFVEGDFFSVAICPICKNALNWLESTGQFEDGWIPYNQVWEVIMDNFFPPHEMDLIPWQEVIPYMKERLLERLGEGVDSGEKK
jgi:hypothetical protein